MSLHTSIVKMYSNKQCLTWQFQNTEKFQYKWRYVVYEQYRHYQS